MDLTSFWEGYDATLARVRDERPDSVEALAAILNDFQPPSSGVAFFGNNADEHLSNALYDAGWDVRYIEADYLWEARHLRTGNELHYVEGDVYPGPVPERAMTEQLEPPDVEISDIEPEPGDYGILVRNGTVIALRWAGDADDVPDALAKASADYQAQRGQP